MCVSSKQCSLFSAIAPCPCRLQLLALVLLTCRLGMLAAEAAAPLKLLERGVSKEALAGLVSLLLLLLLPPLPPLLLLLLLPPPPPLLLLLWVDAARAAAAAAWIACLF
jgi:hypothetical protein